MIRPFSLFSGLPLLVAAVSVLPGCTPQQPFYLFEDGDLSHYVERATEIEYPDVDPNTLGEVDGSSRPLSLQNAEPREVWDLSLEEAVQTSLANGKVLRKLGGAVSPLAPVDYLMQNPAFVATVYDPAIAESDPRQGVEAALSAFDTQLRSSTFWEKNNTPQNIAGVFTQFRPAIYAQDLGTFQAQLQKTAATGGTWALRHNVRYELNNQPVYDPVSGNGSRNYASDWNVNLEAEMRQPLLQGAGVQFNRIAGPGATPGFYNGVMIARMNTDIALADFEAGVRDTVADVENTYWELYYAYRNLDAVVAGRDSALTTWRRIHALYKIGARGGEAEKEAQAREQYFQFRNAVEQALHRLYSGESKLRYMLGLAAADGRLIRPTNEPTSAKVVFDWQEALGEALTRNAELREQKWVLKRREMELIASKNFLMPRLDAVGRYRWLGLGNDLINSDGSSNFLDADSSAYASMTGGRFQEWQLGLEFNMPLGFRREMAGVRNAQMILARERARLQEMELELSHQLSHYIREMESQYVLTQTNWNRRAAAQRQVQAVTEAYDTGTVTIDVLLEAQRRLAVAESDFFRSVVDYNTAIMQVHKRKGSLLEHSGVYLTEGPWPAKAYFDAHRRARERDAGMYLDYGFTRPSVVSRGAIQQSVGDATSSYPAEMLGEPSDTRIAPAEEPSEGGIRGVESIPTPSPAPAAPKTPAPPLPDPDPDPQAARPAETSAPVASKPASRAATGPRSVELAGRLESLGERTKAKPAGGTTVVASGAAVPEPGQGWSVAKQATYDEPVASETVPAAAPSGWRNTRK